MIEPTESETKAVLDNFVEVMIKISEEIKTNPEFVMASPHNAPIKKVNETQAARQPDLQWKGDRQ
jgi:glycine dehydrogenase subunit 2